MIKKRLKSERTKTERSCIVCKGFFNKYNMYRIVRSNGRIKFDVDYKIDGRGAYVCKNKLCLDNLKKQKAINRAYKCQVDDSVYEDILTNLQELSLK